jgi:hypothetical protein
LSSSARQIENKVLNGRAEGAAEKVEKADFPQPEAREE